MSKQEKISPVVRAIGGSTGVLGFAAIEFKPLQGSGFQLNVTLLASFLAGFVFLYVSFFGKYPRDNNKADDADE